MGNLKWAKIWDEHINELGGLCFIPSLSDSKRVRDIIDELHSIVARNIYSEKKPIICSCCSNIYSQSIIKGICEACFEKKQEEEAINEVMR